MALTLSGSNGVAGVDGSAGTPALQGSDSNTGIAFGADTIIGSTGGSERFRVDSSGRLGIGDTAPGQKLVLRDSGDVYLQIQKTGVNGMFVGSESSIGVIASDNPIVFRVGSAPSATERARIDSSGRLLVGTSSTRTIGFWDTPQFLLEGTDYQKSSVCIYNNQNEIYGAVLSLGHSRGTSVGSNTILQNNDFIGAIAFHGSDGSNEVHAGQIAAYVDGTPGVNDMPCRLVFSTTADGASSPTERMRIDSAGRIKFANLYDNTSATGRTVLVQSTGELVASTSSIKYKTSVETIEDSYADAVLGIRPVWYKSLCTADNPDWGWWGFIAEEVAEVDPRLVQWKTSEVSHDENGAAIVTELDAPEPEGVYYDRFVPHLLNLIKRQQAKIESLETRLAALEVTP